MGALERIVGLVGTEKKWVCNSKESVTIVGKMVSVKNYNKLGLEEKNLSDLLWNLKL